VSSLPSFPVASLPSAELKSGAAVVGSIPVPPNTALSLVELTAGESSDMLDPILVAPDVTGVLVDAKSLGIELAGILAAAGVVVPTPILDPIEPLLDVSGAAGVSELPPPPTTAEVDVPVELVLLPMLESVDAVVDAGVLLLIGSVDIVLPDFVLSLSKVITPFQQRILLH
jgi:hypothetical protein